ncbi:hypothetical protein FS837_004596 [Tulasnella sp. UAMH 9824]|nr:hypothetical protein FS837_004596 [Tulasnella sp. UAMH 9824]
MLLTRTQLDDFHPTVARLKERIQLNPEEVTEAEWCSTSRPSWATDAEKGPMEALSTSRPPVEKLSYTAQLALHLTFELLLHTMRHPSIRSKLPFRPDSINPYLTTVFTFLATLFRNEIAFQIVEKYVPWNEFTPFFTQIYQRAISLRSGSGSVHLDDNGSKTSKWFGSSPLTEDWCLHGTEWMRRVYERGFWRTSTSPSLWKAEAGITSEMDVLIPPMCPQDNLTDSAVEGENDAILDMNWTNPQYKRLRWSAETIVRSVDGLIWLGKGGEKCMGIISLLMNKVEL